MVWIPKEPKVKPKPPRRKNVQNLHNGDLISRADAIEAVCDGCVWYKTASCEEGKEGWECSQVNKIRHLPSAEPKTGKWIDCNWSIRCSECGYSMPWAVNFCPNCGADMRGDTE